MYITFKLTTHHIDDVISRVARFLLAQHTKTGITYQMNTQYTNLKYPTNGHKINLIHCKAFQNIHKLEFLVKNLYHHLATLVIRCDQEPVHRRQQC
jgi:hypothetical protein